MVEGDVMIEADDISGMHRAGAPAQGGSNGRTPGPRRWLAPWLAPLALGVPYLAELWREVGGEPLGLLLQDAFAVPLVLAATVLLSAVEQWARAGALTPRLRGWVRWTPRVALLLLVAFLALLSLDVFEEGRSAGEIALGLLLHNLPALALLAAALAAWRWPLVGAVGLAAFAAWWLLVIGNRGFSPSVFLLLAVLPLTLAALFLASALLDSPGRGSAQPA